MNVINFGYIMCPWCCCCSCGDSFVGTDPRNMSLLVTVKTSSDGLDATGFTVKSRSAEATKKTPWIEFSPSRSPVDTTVLVIWSAIRFWRTPLTISPRNTDHS
jgi:hypothetical protein